MYVEPLLPLTPPIFYNGLLSLLKDNAYNIFIVDLWGVIHNGSEPLRGVRACLAELKAQQKHVFFLSNSPRRISFLENHLAKMGISQDLYEGLYSSGENALESLGSAQPLGPAYLAISSYHYELVYGLDLKVVDNIDQAAFILNTGPDPLDLAAHQPWLERAAQKNLPMICVNPDIHVRAGNSLKLCAGALAYQYEQLGGTVSYHGKPYPAVYEALLKRISRIVKVDKEKILAVGDSLTTDILGARNLGLASILVLSGVETNGPCEDHQELSPQLLNHMKEKSIYPTYITPGFYL